MRIRFLETTPSDRPDFPFQVGQVIEWPDLDDTVQRWLESGIAEVVPESAAESAALDVAAQAAVEPRPKRRGSR